MNIKAKKLIIFYRVIEIFVLLYILFLGVINYYIMPRFIVPAVKQFIAENLNADVKLSVKEIGFSPLKGFLLKRVALIGSIEAENGLILNSELVDIDLDWLALFKKQIKISMLEVDYAKLNVSRDPSGVWNFQPVFKLNFDNQSGDFKVFLNRLSIKKAKIDYCDTFDQNNSLKRNLNNVNMRIDNEGGNIYKIFVSSSGDSINKENISASFVFDKSKPSIIGTARINTFYLGKYWNYYLDEIFKPWIFDAESVKADIKFSLVKDAILLKGQYEIKKGRFAYGDFSIRSNVVVSKDARFVFGNSSQNSVDIELALKDGVVSSGENVFIRGFDCEVEINPREISFGKLNGTFFGEKFSLKGKYAFSEQKELSLSGNIGIGRVLLSLKIPETNLGELEVRYNSDNSFLNLKTEFSDLKNQVFKLNLDGLFDLDDLLTLNKKAINPKVSNFVSTTNPLGFRQDDNFPFKFKGKLKIGAILSGELDKLASFSGNSSINAEGLSLFGINFGSFNINSIIDSGVLSANMPKVDFYQGDLSASFKVGLKGSVAQINLSNLDIEDFVSDRPYFAGFKGILGGNFVYSARANNFKISPAAVI
jgi:hypothetical protein